MSRSSRSVVTARAGCFDCNGGDPLWTARNAVAMAARHHDSTGHATWADQEISTFYGERGPSQPDMFSEGATA